VKRRDTPAVENPQGQTHIFLASVLSEGDGQNFFLEDSAFAMDDILSRAPIM